MAAHTHCTHDATPRDRAACRAEAKVAGGMHTPDCRSMVAMRMHDNGLDDRDRALTNALLHADPETWCHCRGFCDHEYCTNVYGQEA